MEKQTFIDRLVLKYLSSGADKSIQSQTLKLFYAVLLAVIIIQASIFFIVTNINNSNNHILVTKTVYQAIRKDIVPALISKQSNNIKMLVDYGDIDVPFSPVCIYDSHGVLFYTVKKNRSSTQNLNLCNPNAHSIMKNLLLPMTNNIGHTVGYITIPKKAFNVHSLEKTVILSVATLILFSFILARRNFHRYQIFLWRRINHLTQTAKSLTENIQATVTFETNSHDEVGRLGNAFEIMLKELRRKEQDILSARDEADKSNQQKDVFLASMSHEIRTPINGIIGTVELLMETKLNDKQHSHASTILYSADLLLDIINDILDFSKIESGKLELELVPFSPHQLIEGVAELMAGKASKKGLEIILDIHREIPYKIIGDPGKLRQILTNLTSNAIKFTQTGHILIKAKPRYCNVDDHCSIVFSVSDTGIGIAKEAQEIIFEKFSQADASTSRQFGGTGLGLTICKQLVELMQGNLQVSSEPKKGSTFFFDTTFKIDKNVVNESMQSVVMNGLKVLIVEDSMLARRILEKKLAELGAHVRSTESRDHAIDLLIEASSRAMPFQIVYISEKLGESQTLNLSQSIKNNKRICSVPVVLMAQPGEYRTPEELYQYAIFGFVVKPIKLADLLSITEVILTEYNEEGESDIFSAKSLNALKHLEKTKTIKFNRPTIMLVEDNKIQAMVLTGILEHVGCNVHREPNGLEAIKHLENSQVDLILMDCDMPLLDGFETTKTIRERRLSQAPIISLTNHSDDSCRSKSAAAGMDDFLLKKMAKLRLTNKLEEWLPEFINNRGPSLDTFNGLHILLVEDNQINAAMVTEMLNNLGFEVIKAHNGKMAIELFEKNKFDLILMDCMLPIMDGFEASQKIRDIEQKNQRKHTPIVALTANTAQENQDKCFLNGMDGYLCKPIRKHALKNYLEQTLSGGKAFSTQNPSENNVPHTSPLIDFAVIEQYNKYFPGTHEEHTNTFFQNTGSMVCTLKDKLAMGDIDICINILENLIKLSKAIGLQRISTEAEELLEKCCCYKNSPLDVGDHLKPKLYQLNQAIDRTKEELNHLPTNINEEKDSVTVFLNETDNNTEMNSGNTVDQTAWDEARSILKDKFEGLVEIYLEDSSHYIEEIKSALEKSDAMLVVNNAHPLKSSSINLGLTELASLAQQIEIAGKLCIKGEKDISDIENLMHPMSHAYDEAQKEIRQRISR